MTQLLKRTALAAAALMMAFGALQPAEAKKGGGLKFKGHHHVKFHKHHVRHFGWSHWHVGHYKTCGFWHHGHYHPCRYVIKHW